MKNQSPYKIIHKKLKKMTIIGFKDDYKQCRYCGMRFHYNGANMHGYDEAREERNTHETVCTKRFLEKEPYHDEYNDCYDESVVSIKRKMEYLESIGAVKK